MCSTHAGAASGNALKATRQVLPQDVVPLHYRVFLDPNLATYKYTGHVDIDVDVAKTTNKLSVNIVDLLIKSASLNGKLAKASSHDEDSQTITWEFADAVEQNSKATLRVEFDGELNDKLCGFYRSVHKDENNKEQVVATTQMEATDCRRAFPCFDEPALKATFDISIAADKSLTVLSNSDVKSTEPLGDGSRQITHFNTTPKMSTYLVAFIVGDLRYVESKHFRVPVRVYATPGFEDRCQFSADLAARTLAFFEESFGIQYPLPKCDMVGIHDFSAGAMENWGLITYRLVDIFYTEGKDSAATKTRVAEVVQHELAHQWFGNLVTMEWWDGLWLNEGFATWMSWYSCNHFFPEWKVWETYVVDSYQGCLRLDGLRSSHPVQVDVARADEVAQIFDAISYLKGSCIIRMVSQFLGEDVFIKGISKYLQRHSYANTTTDDLWNALSEVSGKDVKAFMNSWTRDVGYPIITVADHSGSSEIEINQHRYLATGDVKPEEDETIYPVWLGIRKDDGSVDRSTVLKERSTKVDVGSGPFYKLNADQSGIFRVRYPDSDLAMLAAEGAKGVQSKLSVEDRVGLLSDLTALSGSYTRTSQLLTVVNEWKNDTEPNVVESLLQSLSLIDAKLRFEDDATIEQFRKFREAVVVPIAKKVGVSFKSESDVRQTMLKASLFAAAIGARNQEFIDIALNEFKSKGFKDVEPNLRAPIYRVVAEFGDEDQWKSLLNHYTEGTNGASGNNALAALGYSKNISRKQEVLDRLLDGTFRSQDFHYALGGVCASGKEGTELGWEWAKNNWEKITKLFPVSGSMLGSIVKISTTRFTKKEQLADIEHFFKNKDLKGINMSLDQSKDLISSAITFLENDLGDIKQWLSTKGSSSNL